MLSFGRRSRALRGAAHLSAILAVAFACSACSKSQTSNGASTASDTSAPTAASTPYTLPKSNDEVRVRITTAKGPIVVVLDRQHAPKTVENFLHYADAKFYSGGTFFRAVPGYVIQGGNRPKESPHDKQIVLEPPSQTGIRNVDGAISMARTSDPNSATSEFFICVGDQPALDGANGDPGYAAFGHVTAGMALVRAISSMPTDSEMLVTPVKIVKVERIR